MHDSFDLASSNPSLPDHVRIVIVPSTGQHYLPIKSTLQIDEKTNQIHLDATSTKTNLPATGYFALEFDENQPAFILLHVHAQEISRLTNIPQLSSSAKTFNYLNTILPKAKLPNRYRWYISHDQLAISIRQIPFTNIKHLMHILTLVRQQIYLTRYLHYYLHRDSYDQDHMDDDDDDEERHENSSSDEISLELSFLSPAILSMTCAQSYHLSTFLLHMSNMDTFPLFVGRQQQQEIYLTDESHSLMKLIEKLLREENSNDNASSSKMDLTSTSPIPKPSVKPATIPKLNRRLSCVPPAKPTWRSATTLRRMQPACLTLSSQSSVAPKEKLEREPSVIDDINPNLMEDVLNDDDDPFMPSPEEAQEEPATSSLNPPHHQQPLPRPSLSFHPSTLSRCTSVSSTQSVLTPPIFGLSPATPYPGGTGNPNGNIFFPLARQVSVPEYSPVNSPMAMGPFDPSAFLSANIPTSSAYVALADATGRNQQKKKRRRSDHSADDLIDPLNNNGSGKSQPFAYPSSLSCIACFADNQSPMHATKLTTSGGDQSGVKRNKKPADKNSQQLVRQKSAFKVTDSPTAGPFSQQQLTSPDESPNEFKPLKVVIKRVGDGGNSSNDESQQHSIKQRKKQQQQHMMNNTGSLQTAIRKLPNSHTSAEALPSVLVKSESLDMSQFNSDLSSSSMMNASDGAQQSPRLETVHSRFRFISIISVS